MGRFAVIEAKPWHCGAVLRHLRLGHRRALARMELNNHRVLRSFFDQSSFRRAWSLDGKIAGIAGISGTALNSTGFIWFAMTDDATQYPVSIVKEARRFLDEAMAVKRELATTVLGMDDAAKRLAVFMGFHAAHEGPGSPAFSHRARRVLHNFVDTNPDIRIPVGNSYVVALGYHLDIEETA